MQAARVGIGGMKRNVDDVIAQLEKTDTFTLVSQPSLRGKVAPWTLVWRIWQYAGDVDLYYGISYGQWPRYLFARLRGKRTICHWAGTDVLRVLHKPLHRWWFMKVIRHCIDRHLVVSDNLAKELATLGIQTQLIPLVSNLMMGKTVPLPDTFSLLAYLPADRGEFYGAPIVYALAAQHPEWQVYIVGRDPTPEGKALSNVVELGPDADMREVYPKVTTLVRPTLHDGLPRMVLEALSWGRYVVFSQPFPHCEIGRTIEEITYVLRELEKCKIPHTAGVDYIRETYHEDRIVEQLILVFTEVLCKNKPCIEKSQ